MFKVLIQFINVEFILNILNAVRQSHHFIIDLYLTRNLRNTHEVADAKKDAKPKILSSYSLTVNVYFVWLCFKLYCLKAVSYTHLDVYKRQGNSLVKCYSIKLVFVIGEVLK